MTVETNTYQASILARQTIERLAQNGLPPTPNNYAVYYRYFTGDFAELNAALDALAAQESRLNQDQCTELYERFLSADAERNFFKEANNAIDKEIQKVMSLIDESVKGSDKFGEDLSQFSGKLTNVNSLETLRDAVGKITEETRAVAAQNHKLQQELTVTTSQLSDMRVDFERIHKESQTDPLTEVGNRKYFGEQIAQAIKEARDNGTVLSILMVDIDHFKKFNDTHGHLIGDHVLRLVARTLVENLKGRDTVARYGGEEFVILLPQTRLQDAERVANQLRANLATKQIKRRGSNEVLGAVTISLGAAQFNGVEDIESFIGRADKALYRAKQLGRNCVVTDLMPDV